MENVTIDISRCQTIDDVYGQIYRSLEVPKYCGHNLDALWDVLTGFIDLPITITLRGVDRALSGTPGYMRRICQVFIAAEKEMDEYHVTFEDELPEYRVVADLSKCTTFDEINWQLKIALNYDNAQGNDYFALWKWLLAERFYTPVTLVIRGISSLPTKLHGDMRKLLDIFINSEKEGQNVHVVIEGELPWKA